MKDPTDHPPDSNDLRRRAEALLEAEAVSPEKLTPDQAARLIHELRVHQIELEMQNDELRLSQARLEESRSKFADLYDFAPVGYLTLDAAGRIVEANLTAATLLGVERSKLLNRFFSHFLADRDRRVFRQLLSNGLNLPERRGEFRLQDGSGHMRVMLLDILFLQDAAGQERHRVSLTDITELKLIQDELRLHKEDLEGLVAERTAQLVEVNDKLQEANLKLEAIFQVAPLAIGVFDTEGRLLSTNAAAEHIFGWPREELEGKPLLTLLTGAPHESLALSQRLLQGESLVGVEIEQRCQDGRHLDISFSASPLRDPAGQVTGFVSLAEDITRRKAVEAMRIQALVLANMAEGVTVTDHSGHIVYTNPAFDAMFGYEPGELLGRHSNILNVDPPEKNLPMVKGILRQVNTTGSWKGEFRNCKKGGKPFYTRAHINVLEVGAKKLYISVQEDITQREKTRKMLERQAELLDLAHDAILVRDLKGRISYWNRSAEELYGWQKSEALAKVVYRLLATEFPEPLPAIETRLFATGHWEGELIHTTREGRRLTVASRWSLKRDDAGQPLAILEIGHDITAHKQIEKEVHRLANFPLLNPNPVLEVNDDGEVTYANPAARDLAQKHQLPRGVKDFLPPDLKERFAAVRAGGPREHAFDLTLKDRVYAVSIFFPHDLPTARLYALDITDRKKAEAALRESEASYRSLVELSPDAILVIDRGMYVFANQSAARLFGAASPEDLAGRDVLELVPPDYRDFVTRRIREVLAGDRENQQAAQILRLDGQPVDIEATAQAITFQDQPAILILMRDITARRRAEAALRESQRQAAFLADLIESSSQPFGVGRLDGGIEFFNSAYLHLLGYTKEEFQQLDWAKELTAPEWREQEQALLEELLATGQPVRYEKEYFHKDGSRVPVELLVHLRRDDQGQPSLFYAFITDITERRRAGQALRQSEERLRLSIDAAYLISFEWDIQRDEVRRFISTDPALAPTSTQSPSTFEAVREVVHPEDRELFTANVQAALEREDGRYENEFRIVHPDGNIAWLYERGFVERDQQGRPARLIGLSQDITHRQTTAAALRESEELYRSLFANNHAVMLLIDPDAGIIVDANPAASAYYGYPLSELLGRRIATINILDTSKIFQELQQAALGERRHFEFQHRLASGAIRDVEVISGPILVKGKNLLYSIVSDVTDRHRAAAALRESEERFRLAFENANIGMALVDLNGRYLQVNQALSDMLGYSRPELVRMNVRDLTHPDDLLMNRDFWQRSLKGELACAQFEKMKIHKSGAIVWVHVATSLVRDARGAPLYFVSQVQDVTSRKRAEAALRESEARFRNLFDTMTEGVALHEMVYDEKGAPVDYRILATNPAYAVHTGLTPEETLGKLASEAYGTGEAPYLEVFARVAHVGQPAVFETYFAPLKRHFAVSATSPKPGHFVTVFLDITDRKRLEEDLRQAHDELEQRVQERTLALSLSNEQLVWEIDERQRVEDQLRDSEARFAAFMGHLPGLAVMRDMEGRYLFANPAWEELTGLRQGAWQGKTLAEIWPPGQADLLQELDFQIISSGQPIEGVETSELADGPHHFLTTRFPILDDKGLPYMVGNIAIDITQRRRAEERAAEIGRLYRVLSQVNEAMLRGRDQEALFQEICRIAVEEGLFRLAWVGLTDPLEQVIRVAAKYGFHEGYLDDLVIPLEDVPESRGPTGTAVREGRYDLCNDFAAEPRMAPWRDKALARGYHSSGAFPLRIGGRVVGALTLYASRPGFFTDQEITLLTSLTDNLSFALTSLDREARRRQAEEALADHARLVHDLYNNAPCGYHSLDRDGTIVQINDTELAMLGYTREEVVGRLKFTDLITPETLPTFDDSFPGFKERGWVKDLEYEMVRKDGTVFPILLSATAIMDEAGTFLMSRSSLFDITERQRAEQALAAERRRFLALLENLPAYVYLQAPDYSMRFANREFRERFGDPHRKACHTLIWGKEEPCVDCPTFTVFKTGQPKEWEWTSPDGRAYHVYDYPFADVDGAPLVLEMGIDITDRKKAEETIREQARHLEAFFAHTLTPVVFLDPQFNFLRVNEAYSRACQLPAQDFIGRNHFELYPHPENQAIFTEVVQSKTLYQVQAKPFEFPDHPEWGVTYWDWTLTPILDPAGDVDFLVLSLRDVTRRVLAEQARSRFIEILEATPDFVGIADFHGRLQYLNRAGRAMVGVGENEDLSPLKVLDLHPEKIGRLIMTEGAPAAIREGAWQAELAFQHRDGREIPVSQVVLAHQDTGGRVQFFSTIARDISDMKAAQASILRQTAIVNGINRIFRETLTSETETDLGQTCLTIAEKLTASKFGFLDEINQDGLLDSIAISYLGWGACKIPGTEKLVLPKSLHLRGIYSSCLREGRSEIINNPSRHPDRVGVPEGHPAITAFLGVPLKQGNQTFGLIGLGNKEGGYTLDDREAVENLAPAIVEALMHHRAEDSLKTSESRLRYLADQLLTAQENERKRLAAELHDELGHALLALKLHLSSIEKKLLPEQQDLKAEIRAQLDYIHEVIQDVRRLYHDLSPGDVEDLGITKALRTLIEDFAGHIPRISWQLDLTALGGLFSLPVQTIIYRIVQEALTNIGKHANCTEVTITSRKEQDHVQFTIQDNGAGFDLQELGARRGRGLGLVAMEERLNMIGGSFHIHSRAQEGTRISFTVPTLSRGEQS